MSSVVPQYKKQQIGTYREQPVFRHYYVYKTRAMEATRYYTFANSALALSSVEVVKNCIDVWIRRTNKDINILSTDL